MILWKSFVLYEAIRSEKSKFKYSNFKFSLTLEMQKIRRKRNA